jgi:hypothetical protein
VSAVNEYFRSFVGLSLLLTFVPPVFGQLRTIPATKPNPTITVRIHDYVHVPPETIARAQDVTSEILREAGVEVVWLHCNIAVPVEKRPPACARLGPLDFVMNLVDRIQPLSPKLREIAMGLAVVPPDGGEGDLAYLSTRQASSVAHEYSAPLEIVLGLGAAHEIGHLLLGENAHTSSGLMKARWGADELKRGSHGNLSFTADQSDRMRANLVVRELAREEEVLESAMGIQIANASRTEH